MINLILAINPLEQMVGDGFATVFNNNLVLAVILISFFLIFVILQGTRLDAKVAVMIPVCFLAIAFNSIFIYIIVFGVGILFWKALSRTDQG